MYENILCRIVIPFRENIEKHWALVIFLWTLMYFLDFRLSRQDEIYHFFIQVYWPSLLIKQLAISEKRHFWNIHSDYIAFSVCSSTSRRVAVTNILVVKYLVIC